MRPGSTPHARQAWAVPSPGAQQRTPSGGAGTPAARNTSTAAGLTAITAAQPCHGPIMARSVAASATGAMSISGRGSTAQPAWRSAATQGAACAAGRVTTTVGRGAATGDTAPYSGMRIRAPRSIRACATRAPAVSALARSVTSASTAARSSSDAAPSASPQAASMRNRAD